MVWKRVIEPLRLGHVGVSSGSRTALSLNAAYVHLTSGPAVALRLNSQYALPIDEVYILLDATTGTRANVSMVAKVYDCASSGTQPGSTLKATSSSASLPATDDAWIRFVFPSPYTPSVGEWLFVTFENTAAVPATDFPQILNGSQLSSGFITSQTAPYSTTNGFSTAGTSQVELTHVVKQGSEIYGNPYSILSSLATFTGRRGIVFGPDWKKFISNRIRFQGASVATSIQIFELATAPTGTPLYSQAISGLDALSGNMVFNFDFSTLSGVGPWVLCVNTSSNVTVTALNGIEGYTDYPTIFDEFYDYLLSCPNVIQSGSSWVVDKSKMGGTYVEASALAASSPSSSGLLSKGFMF